MRTTSQVGLFGLLATTSLASRITVAQNKGPLVESGPTGAQYTYPGFALDAPRVENVNSTVFDWWYFDAVSSDIVDGDLSSVTVVFHDGSGGGFQQLPHTPNKLHLYLSGTWPNGTMFRDPLSNVSAAVVLAEGTGSSGNWGGYGGWDGDVESGEWEVHFADEARGVNGSFRMEQIAPPHFACSLVEPGASEAVVPHVGWVNTVPDARATVEFDINGTTLAFTGVGYHDKNWGDRPFFNESVLSWYWGHARVGPYSIVWFDTIVPSGDEHFSAYVARDGEVLASNCNNGTVVVRPWGGEDTYPPPAGTDTPAGFILTFAEVQGREFRVNVTTLVTPVPIPLYNRFLGVAEGTFEGEDEVLRGAASYEQFKAQ